MKKFIYILFLQLVLLSANGQILSSFHHYKTKTTNNGLVFVNGTPVSPPYYFEMKDSNVYVNDIKLYQYTGIINTYGKYYDSLPSIPDNINKNSDINDLMGKKNEEGYLSKSMKYFYSHYNYEEAIVKLKEFIKQLPNVKSVEFNASSCDITPFSGERLLILNFFSEYWKEYNRKYYHKQKVNKDRKKKDFEHSKALLNNLYIFKLDSENSVIVFFGNDMNYVIYSKFEFKNIVDSIKKITLNIGNYIDMKFICRSDTTLEKTVLNCIKQSSIINEFIKKINIEQKNKNDGW